MAIVKLTIKVTVKVTVTATVTTTVTVTAMVTVTVTVTVMANLWNFFELYSPQFKDKLKYFWLHYSRLLMVYDPPF
jgi:hypothetical protein